MSIRFSTSGSSSGRGRGASASTNVAIVSFLRLPEINTRKDQFADRFIANTQSYEAVTIQIVIAFVSVTGTLLLKNRFYERTGMQPKVQTNTFQVIYAYITNTRKKNGYIRLETT